MKPVAPVTRIMSKIIAEGKKPQIPKGDAVNADEGQKGG
jgi:hypothetical protein